MPKIVIDIETIATPVQDWFIEAKKKELQEEYKKDETVQKHLDEAVKGWWKQWGGSRPICIAMENLSNNEVWCEANDDSEQLVSDWIVKVAEWSPYMSPVSFVGFNVVGFDLLNLHLQIAKRRHQEKLFKLGRYSCIDLADQPYGWKTDRKGKTLDYYARAFGLEGKEGVTGDMVAKLWAMDLEDGGKRVKDYCLSDCMLTSALYRKMSLFWDL